MKASTLLGGAAQEWARGRKFSSQDLQRLLLALLGDEPRHGYQLMQQLETRSNGCYRPSAGVVYPALTHLEEAGYTQGVAAGKRRGYTLTEAGRRQVAATREAVELLWAKLDFLGQKMALVRRAFADDEALSARDPHGGAQSVLAAIETLKAVALADDRGSAPEQRRIVAVLERAAQEILAPADTTGPAR